MPRRSAASLNVPTLVAVPREPPPPYLAPEEAAEWVQVTKSLPPDWFAGGSLALLESYCRSIVNARWMAARMSELERGSSQWREWHRLHQSEVKLATTLAPRLRLFPRWERTKSRKTLVGPRPWQDPTPAA